MTRVLINPGSTRAMYEKFHFSQAVRAGDMVWVSGQVGIDAQMRPGTGLTEQARLAFTGLKTVMEAAGAELSDVVELVTFHTDLRGGSREFGAVKDEFFPNNYPAWTAVGVTQLAMPELLVEIRAVAVVGSALS
jgi:enamine deaminase RidA (YjgF/YER057c/UK114 family)